jgi:hypothetical protein
MMESPVSTLYHALQKVRNEKHGLTIAKGKPIEGEGGIQNTEYRHKLMYIKLPVDL